MDIESEPESGEEIPGDEEGIAAEAAEDVSTEDAKSGAPKPSGSGRRLRILLLTANVFVFIASFVFIRVGGGGFGYFSDTARVSIVIVGVCQALHVGPVILATALAAWGPWRPLARGLGYAVISIIAVLVHEIQFSAGRLSHQGWPQTIDAVLGWLSIMVPAIFMMVLLASWLRLRIGPEGIAPVRLSILDVMCATAIMGAVVAVKIATAEWANGYFPGAVPLEAGGVQRQAVLAQTFLLGPLYGVMTAVVIAAAYRWWARLISLCVVMSYAGFGLYFIRQNAPTFPAGQGNLLFAIYGGVILGMLAMLLWTAFTFRMLDRSGWPCSRRA